MKKPRAVIAVTALFAFCILGLGVRRAHSLDKTDTSQVHMVITDQAFNDSSENRTLQAEDPRGAGGRRIEALALEEIGAVDRRRHHAQAQVAGTCLWCGLLAEAKHPLVPGRIDQDRLHGRYAIAAPRSSSPGCPGR